MRFVFQPLCACAGWSPASARLEFEARVDASLLAVAASVSY